MCSVSGSTNRRQENISSVYISNSQSVFDLVPPDAAECLNIDQDQGDSQQLKTDYPQDSNQLSSKDFFDETTTAEASHFEHTNDEHFQTVQIDKIEDDIFTGLKSLTTVLDDLFDVEEQEESDNMVITSTSYPPNTLECRNPVDDDRGSNELSNDSASDEDSILIQDPSNHWHRFQNSDSEIETVIDFDVFSSNNIDRSIDSVDTNFDELQDISNKHSTIISDFWEPPIGHSSLESAGISVPIDISIPTTDFILKSPPDSSNIYLESETYELPKTRKKDLPGNDHHTAILEKIDSEKDSNYSLNVKDTKAVQESRTEIPIAQGLGSLPSVDMELEQVVPEALEIDLNNVCKELVSHHSSCEETAHEVSLPFKHFEDCCM
jgi:hypothetical protein